MKIVTTEDISEVKKLAMEFIEVSGYKEFSDEQTIDDLILNIVNSSPAEKIIILQPDVGFIAGVATPFLFGKGRLATEIAWWVTPDQRGSGAGMELMKAFEYWAKNIAECKMISMTSLDKEVEKYYKKNGYKLYERAYMKVF